VARVGNYAQEVDSTGMDDSMKAQMFGTKMDKTESSYLKGAKNKVSATEAVRRARKANKQPPLRPEE
jgi:hypothetical protein